MALTAPREIARDFLYLSVARVFSLAVGFLRSLFIPRLLGTTSYGMWKTLGIIQSYAQFSDLGAAAALKREIPFYTQRGEPDKVAEVRDIAFLVNHVALLLVASGVLAVSFAIPEPAYARALRLFVLLLYISQVNNFLDQLLLWRKEFRSASQISLILAVIETALAVGGTWLYGIDGLIVGTFAAYAAAVLIQLRRIRFEIGFAFRWAAYVDLVKVGFPSHVNGLLYNIFMSIDRVLILPALGLDALGLYGLGMTINEYLFQFSYALGNAISPRLVERWSESRSMAAMRPIVEKPTLAIAVAAPAVLGSVYFLAEGAVEVALPAFRGAVVPLQILLVGTFFSSLHRGLSSFFLAIRKQARLFPAYGGAILLNAALVSAALAGGWGIVGVAVATSTALAAFSLTLITMAMSFFLNGLPAHARFLGTLLAPLAWGAAAVGAGAAARAWALANGPILAGGIGLAAFGLVYAPALYLGYRRLQGRSARAEQS